jgi:hypothetical protein
VGKVKVPNWDSPPHTTDAKTTESRVKTLKHQDLGNRNIRRFNISLQIGGMDKESMEGCAKPMVHLFTWHDIQTS